MVNMTISRLRSSIEAGDIVLADKEVPSFNEDKISIDAERPRQFLEHAERRACDSELMIATPSLLNVLNLWKGEVLFPTLYDDFFENLHEEFKARVRSTWLRIAERLIYEGDYTGASEILEHIHEFMPEDGEIAELLVEALELREKRVEAGRVRSNSMGE